MKPAKPKGRGGAGRGQGRKAKDPQGGPRVVKTLRLSAAAWSRLQAEQLPEESLGDTASRLLAGAPPISPG